MVSTHSRLDRTFAALCDPTRRSILARLGEGSASVSELAQPLPVKLPAVMKHLDVLEEAGLVRRTKLGRIVTVELRSEPIQEAMGWLGRYERFWNQSLDRLVSHAEARELAARATRGKSE